MDETAETGADTGGSGDATCPRVTGSGCGSPELQGAECGPDGEPEAQVEAAPGAIRGGSCGCDLAPPMVGWALLLVIVALVRRSRWVPLLLLLCTSTAWGQVDAQQVRVVDGGDFPTLRDANLGPKWTAGATFSLNHARNLALLEGVPDARVLVEQVTTRAVSASLNLGGITQIGVSAPWHWPATVDGERYGILPGDLALWLAVPLTGEENRLRGSWTVHLDLPAGREDLYLGDPGVVRGAVALEAPAGPLRALGNLSVNFHRDVPLPGAVFGNHWGYGLGLRAEPAGPMFAVLELQGETPVKPWAGDPSQYPLNGVLSLGSVPTRVLSVSVGLGTGLTRGLGSPSFRAVGAIDVRPRTAKDSDEDGIADLRDLCRQQPEDLDGFRDNDGCPDPDNDQDGLLDERDDCPISAENINDYEDWDGCPERVTFLTLRVVGGDDLEQAEVQLGTDEPFVVLPGESVERVLELDSVQLTVQATDHEDATDELVLTGHDTLEHLVTLTPIAFGRVTVEVVDESERPIPEALVEVGDEAPVSVEEPLRIVAGLRRLTVSAEGWRSERLQVEVAESTEQTVTVTLSPGRVEVEGNRLEVADRVDFALDEAELVEGGREVLEDLARWLDLHPEVELLRVEGHADASGTSRHNHELSLRRAEVVRETLVELGVDADRLQAIGTGEARPDLAGPDADRRVDFLVLIWADAGE